MKIALVTLVFLPKWIGGTEVATLRVAECLVWRGHEVHVVTSLDRGLPKFAIERGIRIHRVKRIHLKYVGLPSFWIAAFYRLMQIRPQVVHVQGVHIGISAVLLKAVAGIPYMVCGRGTDVFGEWPLKDCVTPLVMRRADVVAGLTECMAKALYKTHAREIRVLGNGVDLDRFAGLPRRTEARKQLGLSVAGPIVEYVGRLAPVKGVQYLVEAMNVVRMQVPSAHLIIVGEGTTRPLIERLIDDLHLCSTVTLVGEVANSSVPLYMAAADVFALPSLSEGFPNVLLEAMAGGLPIVATQVGGMAEIVEDGVNGFLVPSEDPARLASGLLDILRNDGVSRKMSASNKAKSLSYSWDHIVPQLEILYQSMIGSQSRPK
jgi:glycosyltransferase involved in cell wall biosynthesis